MKEGDNKFCLLVTLSSLLSGANRDISTSTPLPRPPSLHTTATRIIPTIHQVHNSSFVILLILIQGLHSSTTLLTYFQSTSICVSQQSKPSFAPANNATTKSPDDQVPQPAVPATLRLDQSAAITKASPPEPSLPHVALSFALHVLPAPTTLQTHHQVELQRMVESSTQTSAAVPLVVE